MIKPGDTVKVPNGMRYAGCSITVESTEDGIASCTLKLSGQSISVSLKISDLETRPYQEAADLRDKASPNTSRLKWNIRQFANSLSSSDFNLGDGGWSVVRNINGIEQGAAFQTGSRSRFGQFCIDVYLQFRFIDEEYRKITPELADARFDWSKRLGYFSGLNEDRWWSFVWREDEKVDVAFREPSKLIEDQVVPFFNQYQTLEHVIKAYDEKIISFGSDKGWALFTLGFVSIRIGDIERAKKAFEALLEAHSSLGDYVARRATVAKNVLSRL